MVDQKSEDKKIGLEGTVEQDYNDKNRFRMSQKDGI